MKFTIKGNPITKKNSSQIVTNRKTGRPFIIPSKKYKEYEGAAGLQIPCKWKNIQQPANVKCVYYMKTKRRVDLVNLLEATCDILTHYGVLADDNSNIVVSHDGSRVMHDKENPRAEIEITEVKE